MARGSFIIQNPEDAQRHLQMLTQGLKRVAVPGLISGVGCGVIAVLLGRFVVINNPGSGEGIGLTSVAWLMAAVLASISSAYLFVAWALARRKRWARYAAAAVFVLKILFCVRFGLASLSTLVILLLFSSVDFYGLWVLLSKKTGQLFSSPEPSRASGKPANLVT